MLRGIPTRRAETGKGLIDLPPDLPNLVFQQGSHEDRP